MRRLFDSSFWKGAAGALVVVSVLAVGYWGYLQYRDFVQMRAWIVQMDAAIQQQQKQQAPQ